MAVAPSAQRTSMMLREARRRMGLSLFRLGGEVKITPARIHRLEAVYGAVPRADEARLLACRLGLDLAELQAAIDADCADRDAAMRAAARERTAHPLPGGR